MKVVRTYLCLICLIALAHSVPAQSNPPTTSDLLKEKISEVESIDTSVLSAPVKADRERSLLVLYDKYVSGLQRDIDALTKIQAAVGADSDPQRAKNIEKLVEEQTAASNKLKILRGEPSQLTATTTHIPRSCEELFKSKEKKIPHGAIWCGRDTTLPVYNLAELSAPILWFSPDEPLRRNGGKIPEALPGDQNQAPVVYYRVSELRLGSNAHAYDFNAKTENLDLTMVQGLTLRYYFYYSQDYGFNGHAHDLESIRLEILFTDRDASGEKVDGYVAYVSKVIGAAHGVTWYYNQLDTEADISLPITILVEEGKHASSPDRNADGHYSPGYDVNRRFNDAWGVRDVIGSGELGNIGYDGYMTKPRNPADMLRVNPQEIDVESLLRTYTGAHKSSLMTTNSTYKLVRVTPDLASKSERQPIAFDSANKVRQDTAPTDQEATEEAKKDVARLEEFMARENFDDLKVGRSHGDVFIQRAIKKGLGIERSDETLDALTIGYRYDEGHGFFLAPPFGRYRLGVFGGYAVPKFNYVRSQQSTRFSFEGLYTPSAARRVDWYAALGSEWSRRGENRELKPRFVSEGGLKFRFNFNKFLVGARIGLRASGLKQPDKPRLIFELGPGAF